MSDAPEVKQTPPPDAALVRIIAHTFERSGLNTWNNARVFQLAKDLSMTLPVLCARAGMFDNKFDDEKDLMRLTLDRPWMARCIRKNLWPVCVAIQFERLEKEVEVSRNNGILFSTCDMIDSKILAGTLGNSKS